MICENINQYNFKDHFDYLLLFINYLWNYLLNQTLTL